MLKQLSITALAMSSCIGLSLPGLASAASDQDQAISGVVTKSTDGDTIHFRKDHSEKNEKDWKVRMVGIDAPELHLPVRGGPPVGQKPWGEWSAKAMEEISPVGTAVKLVTFGTDIHHRVLGRIERDGEDINLKMIQLGWAIPYVICDGENCNSQFFKKQHVELYLQACETARSEGLGIFDPKKPMKEMPFEFRLRMQERKPDKYVGDFVTHKLYNPKDYSKVDVCKRIFFQNSQKAIEMEFYPVQ